MIEHLALTAFMGSQGPGAGPTLLFAVALIITMGLRLAQVRGW